MGHVGSSLASISHHNLKLHAQDVWGKKPHQDKASVFLHQITSVIFKTQESGTALKGYLGHRKLQPYSYNCWQPNLSLPHPRRKSEMPFSPTLEFLGKWPKMWLRNAVFSTAVPYWGCSRSRPQWHTRAVERHFAKALCHWWGARSTSEPRSYIRIWVHPGLCPATQTDISEFRKTLQEKGKKKKTKELQHMRFGAWFQTGQEVRNICISMATLKVNSSQSPFPSSRSASDSNSFSRRDLPPDVIASALPSRLEAFPKQSLRVAWNCAETAVLVWNCLLSLGADLKNKFVLRWRNSGFPWKANGRKEGFYKGKNSFTTLLPTI